MTPYYADPLVTLLHGDCLEVMAELGADSVDAVVTDPPYGLEFMGKDWDRFVPASRRRPEWDGRRRNDAGSKWEGAVRDRGDGKPGGPSFSVDSHYNPNTKCLTCGKWKFDKNRCRCEAPDWEPRIRHEAPTQLLAFQAWCEQWGREALRVTRPGGYLLAFGGTRTHHRLVCALEDAGWIIRDELTWIYASGFPKGRANLKPAHEPIVLARKPGKLRELGIEVCRIGTADTRGKASPTTLGVMNDDGWQPKDVIAGSEAGRWPSNLLLQDPELFDEPNPYVVGSGATDAGSFYSGPRKTETAKWTGVYSDSGGTATGQPGYGDSGGYSRFFIVPKSPRHERNRGLTERSSHPTVKPIDLMRHLVRLVTPVGGTVLDPFLGSGTTCLAASEEGFRSIGIERELEYLEIAKGRLMATPMGLGLDVPAGTKAPPKPSPAYYPDPMTRKSPKGWKGQWRGDPADKEPAA